MLPFVGLYRPPTPSRRCDFQFGVWYSSVCSAIVVCIGLCGAAARRSHFVSYTLALRRTTWLSIASGPFWLLRCPPSRASSPKQESVPLLPAPVSASRRAVARQWGRRHATVVAVRRSTRVGADASQSARSRANGTSALLHFLQFGRQ